MTDDYRSFIQFHHPGTEHRTDTGTEWNTYEHDHMRKFMQFRGEWIGEDDHTCAGELRAWGEWEAQSKLLRNLDQSGDARLPANLWRPCYERMPDYHRLHNTDPFIFGSRFLYSNCKQTGALKRLSRGSVIAFGSHFRNEWVLDTVLVVARSVEYRTPDVRTDLAGSVPDAFLEATGGPISANGKARTLKLYRGATPADRVCGMFSFFPATPELDDVSFKRPRIRLPCDYFNEGQTRGEEGRWSDLSLDTLRELWQCLVDQVRDAGLVLGTYAELPERRGA